MRAGEQQGSIHAAPRCFPARSALAHADARTTMAHTRTMRDARRALRCRVVSKIAGGAVLSLREFLERNHGAGSFARALDELEPGDAEPLRSIILPVNWYPMPSFVGALHAASRLSGDPAFYDRYGTFAAEYEIASFQRLILRFSTPAFFMDRAGRLWNRFHDSGEWQVEGGGKRLRGTLRDFTLVDPRYCRVLAAWIKRAGEMTGSHGDVAHPECRALGGEVEVFEGWWS
jgi:hypothetical protein